ncbi:uncharacterized protein EV420DRAFT_1654977 [Desarmillaria tabescens]|uniref:Uncharacterized protein n=1 Tax=Armillaria tabescens TaxID=1929756 RepID=A0AA39J293_ARMTA|nr:uncharacterized protein EV420DRAFT_1654977 [Desarmillaria tabescens]KAK0433123.1 hypothetical protein EV420DRAFT_1654977 [Desarmillaria tabescens]
MSSIVLPSRGKCIQVIDNIQYCQCQWFFPPNSNTCECGHGIHAHTDYVSTVVHHYPMNQCAAFVQQTSMEQRCTCGVRFCEHITINNSYRFPEPWTVLDYFNPDSDSPSPSAIASDYSDDANSSFALNTTSFPSTDYNDTISFGDARSTPLIPEPIYSSYATSTSSTIHLDTTQTPGGYNSDDYFA